MWKKIKEGAAMSMAFLFAVALVTAGIYLSAWIAVELIKYLIQL